MFDIGPMDLLVLAIVGILVVGPDRLPGLARDAARMIRTVRELLIGTRGQLRDELGPELAALRDSGLGSDLDVRKALARLLSEDAPSQSTSTAVETAVEVEMRTAPPAGYRGLHRATDKPADAA
jgi:sec-independent protein translocase protein TatB